MNRDTEMAKRWTIAGDRARKQEDYSLAVSLYKNAFLIEKAEGAKYLIPRISACYRKMNRPESAIRFYNHALEKQGGSVIDNVVLTAISSAYSDLEEWEDALDCADHAAFLNDGIVDEYLENVYGRIRSNYHY